MIQWFEKEGKYLQKCMIQATLDSELINEMQELITPHNNLTQIQFTEKPGAKLYDNIKASLKANSNNKRECFDKTKCLQSQTEKGGDCRKPEITYQLRCPICGMPYKGMSGRCGHVRSAEHVNNNTSMMINHGITNHGGNIPNYEMTTLSSFLRDPLARKCAEGIEISKQNDKGPTMNSRNEWKQPGHVNVSFNTEKTQNSQNNKSKKWRTSQGSLTHSRYKTMT